MTAFEKYELWLKKLDNSAGRAELDALKGNDKEITDRFYTDLEFGTAGLRGIVGMGTNRMNTYTVGRAAQGLASWLLKHNMAKKVVISRDPRHFSEEFAKEAAAILAANGIAVCFFQDITPTPMLSFAVRYLNCGAGIMITASHNPREYNGFKCYGPDGGQMTDAGAGQVLSMIESTDFFTGIKSGNFDSYLAEGLIQYAPNSVFEAFLKNATDMSIHPEAFSAGLNVLYTPLNGTGLVSVTTVLKRMGLEHLSMVRSQKNPDGDFPTCPYPNPEMRPAFDEAMKEAETLRPELVFATDPDSDRLACAVRRGDGYTFLSGNEVGCLFVFYLLTELKATGRLPKDPLIIKTIVTSRLTDRICADLGCQLKDVLTGFKYVAEQVLLLEKSGKQDRFIMGFEESVGYLFGQNVRDKDAVAGALLLCEMASFWKLQGMDLVDILEKLYEKYGRFFHKTLNLVFAGEEGKGKMSGIMNALRQSPPLAIGGRHVLGVEDYLPGLHGLPSSNVLIFDLGSGYSAIARPSGTEPKLKFYLTAVGTPGDDGEKLLRGIAEDLTDYCK